MIEQNTEIIKTNKDAEIFFDAILNPQPPNENLINLAKKYKKYLKF